MGFGGLFNSESRTEVYTTTNTWNDSFNRSNNTVYNLSEAGNTTVNVAAPTPSNPYTATASLSSGILPLAAMAVLAVAGFLVWKT